MSPSRESSLFVLVELRGAVSEAVCDYPENKKHLRYHRAGADLAVGHDSQDSLGSSTHVVDTAAYANAHFSLSLKPGPKDISKGFVFGSDPQTCDIILAKDKTTGISGNHFSINVDWRSGNPLITCLTPDGGTGIHILSLSESLWKLYLRGASKEIEPNTPITVKVSRRMQLIIHNPSRNRNEFGYNRHLQEHLKRCQNAIPNMSHMKLYEPEQTPLMISRTRGLTGREYVTTTSSVGDEIVLCEARGHQNWAGDSKTFIVKRFRNTSDAWKKHAKSTLSTLRALRQLHIITPEDIITDGTECMPVYLPEPQETLADRLASGGYLTSKGPLQETFACRVLAQVFEGLRFLHENNFVHGSLYPGSIRFESPSNPWTVKISDIGLYPYVELDNPEERQLYASQRLGTGLPLPVWDTWSAGVVGLLLLNPDGLPTRKRSHSQRQWAITVENHAVDFRNQHPTVKNKAARFITSVLKVEYEERLSAEEYLQDPWLKPKRLPTGFYWDESSDPYNSPSYEEPKDEDESEDSTETEDTIEAEEVSDEDTETEEPRSSQAKGKRPLYSRRASSGNQPRQPTRSPISKGKQQQPQRSRRTSFGTSAHQLLSMTPQSIPSSPSTPIGSRHTTGEHDNYMRGFKGSRPSK